ncbi:hypothetical protein XELAEV_18037145mg [Xenopus laevis]|uniref:SWIM-type domain-containing protein n=1 Tax=Xenopus laevis TaxID=8355 RepID=A0A974CBL2_XENLA|nr:hypothetical protein XELAEV_18037145mg [Xenopus laevis]
MELMFAEWEDGERFSFEDSDRFEEDSLCSFISEAESLCQNWRGWRKQSGGPNSPTVKIKDGLVNPLVELSAKQVAFHIPFEVVEKVYPPVPEQLQLRIAFWSFPENEEDIRLYSCLANGSADEFQRGEQLFRMRAVKDPLQIGFHLSATVVPPQMLSPKGAYNVAVMFDRCRITSCSCTCGAGAKWCSHVVALCLFRIHNASAVCLRAPVSESLSRLQRDQLQKFAQYLISELPQQILPTAQRLLDELLSSQSTAINTVCGAPAGPSASDQSTWYLDESTLSDNIKKTLHKFCGPSPVVFSDVNSMYLSSTEPPAAAEWACLLRPLRGREPEGIWNLLSIVREMFKRRDTNAAPLLEILTDQCLTYEQITGWWYNVRTSASHSSASGHTGRSNGQSEVAAHACASMCDEMVVLWRLAVLDPTISPQSIKPEEMVENGAVGGGKGESKDAEEGEVKEKGEEEDDYQAYYLSHQEAAKNEDEKGDEGLDEEQDIFAGLKPLEQENRMEVLFACAEALYAHGYRNKACRLTVELAQDLLANPPDLKVELPPTKGKKNKVSTSKQTWIATNTLSKAAFLLTVLSERQEYHNLAFCIGMFALELQRPPASTKALERCLTMSSNVPLIYFIFSLTVVSPTGSRPPSRNRNNEMPGDEELGFEAAVAALGMKTTVSEAEHPLLCEGTRREKGDLALALMITYKDDQSKLKKILDKLLDRESQTHKPQTLSSFYSSSKPAAANQKSPSKHASQSSASILISGTTPAHQQQGVANTVHGGLGENLPEKSTQDSSQKSTGEPSGEAHVYKQEGKVPSRLALGNRGGYNGRCWGSPVRQKKKHTAKTVEVGRYKGRRLESHAPHVPNQPSEAAAHFYFELAKTVLIKAGGNSSTSIFTHPSSSGGHQGPHRNLHLCAFEIGLYALGLHNFVSPNWLSRTYSSHVSWITGQAMEIGSAALNILVECWDGHLTPPEVASLADRASRARDSNMVRAAAELALSCLPHAHALNPNEIQRALVQCKEQDNMMLEKACMAVEDAAKGGGVYPEVLFEVAHQWYWLYEQMVGGTPVPREGATGCSTGGARSVQEAVRGLSDNRIIQETSTVTVATAVTAATVVPVISVGSTIYQQHTAMAHAHTQGLHPYTTLQTHIPSVCNPQYIGIPRQQLPQPAIFPVPGALYTQGVHPAFIGAQYPYTVTTPSLAATAVSFPGAAVPSLTQIAVHPYHAETGLSLSSNVAIGNVHTGTTFPAIQGSTMTTLSTQPASLVTPGFPVEDEQHSQPVSPQGLHYLHSAYRVGMLALEMLGRRAHNDHPNNFSRSPPYTEDVKWLLGLAAKLGVNYVHQFCVGAAKGVLSPFVLQEIIMEALQRLNPAHIHNHLRTPAFHQLVQRCQQSYIQYIHHRLIHLTPADYDDFVNAIRSARSAFCLTPLGAMQFNDILQNLKRNKQTKELWQRVSLEMATFSP